MEISKTGNPTQDNCEHEFISLGKAQEKTLLGYYKYEEDYKPGEMYKQYFCIKCSRIVFIDYNIEDDSPVTEFEKEYKVIHVRKR